MKPLLFFVGLLILLIIGGGLLSEQQEKREWRDAKMSPNLPEMVIPRASILHSAEELDEHQDAVITGLVTNNTGETISSLSVAYSLFDATGAKIGTARDSITGLGAHECWRFKARVFERGAKRYRFDELTMR